MTMSRAASTPGPRTQVRWSWQASVRKERRIQFETFVRPCRPIALVLPPSAFALLTAASYMQPVCSFGRSFELWRDFGRERWAAQYHCMHVLLARRPNGAVTPTRLVICRDDVDVTGLDADERTSHLHASVLIDHAGEITSAKLALVMRASTGHEALAAEAVLRRAVDQAKRRHGCHRK